ncbi:MAG: hypothetical protein ACFFCQ_17425 [Promethearchaeota archaeon]
MKRNDSKHRLLQSLEMDEAFPTGSIPLTTEVNGENIPLARLIRQIQMQVTKGNLQQSDLQWVHFLRDSLRNKVKKFAADLRSSRITLSEATLHRSYILGLKTAAGHLEESLEFYFRKNGGERKSLLILLPNPDDGWTDWLIQRIKEP